MTEMRVVAGVQILQVSGELSQRSGDFPQRSIKGLPLTARARFAGVGATGTFLTAQVNLRSAQASILGRPAICKPSDDLY